jgi:hypothetical protein
MEQSAEIMEAFERRRRRRFIVPGISVIVWGLLMIFERGHESFWAKPMPFFAIFGVIAIGMLGFHIWNWRCPACGSLLGRNIRSPKFFPNCGVQLQPV